MTDDLSKDSPRERPWQHEHWADLRFLLRYQVHDAYVDVALYVAMEHDESLWFEPADANHAAIPIRDIHKAKALVRGHVKFDSCADLQIGHEGYWHICDKDELTRFGAALERTHDLALRELGYTP